MNSEYVINSIYNPRRKLREPFVFPKITKAEATPPDSKFFGRGPNRKYQQQNIFKIEDQKRHKVRLHIEEERIREQRSRQCEELQAKIAELTRSYQQQMRELQEKQRQAAARVDCMKKEQYQTKLGLWELKNEVIDLQAILQEEENQYNRLYQEVGFEQGQAQEAEEPQVGLEGGEEVGMEEGSHPLSVSQGQLDEVAPIEQPSQEYQSDL